MTDQAIAQEFGERFRALRLRRNSTLEELAKNTMLSVSTLKSLEKGQAKLSTMIAVLRELKELDQLHLFLEAPEIDPIAMLDQKGKLRIRASRIRHSTKLPEPSKW